MHPSLRRCLVLLWCCIAGCAVNSRAPALAACVQEPKWSTWERIGEAADSHPLGFPSLTVSRGRAVLAGMGNITRWRPDAAIPASGAPLELRIQSSDSSVNSTPRGGAWFAYPRVVYDANGELHLLWAEPDTAMWGSPKPVAFRQIIALPLTSVWHSKYTGGKWSEPELVFRGDRVDWTPSFASQPRIASDGSPVVALSALDSAGSPVVIVASIVRGRWRTDRLPTELSSFYADVATDSSGALTVAYVRPTIVSGRARYNRVFVRRLREREWGPERLISESTSGETREPRLALDSAGIAHVVWFESKSSSGAPRLWHSQSAGGDTWSRPRDVPLPGAVSGLQLLGDRCGSLHLVVERPGSGGIDLVYSRFAGGSWQSPIVIDSVGGSHVLTLERDSVYLSWEHIGQRFDRASGRPPVVYPVWARLPLVRAARD